MVAYVWSPRGGALGAGWRAGQTQTTPGETVSALRDRLAGQHGSTPQLARPLMVHVYQGDAAALADALGGNDVPLQPVQADTRLTEIPAPFVLVFVFPLTWWQRYKYAIGGGLAGAAIVSFGIPLVVGAAGFGAAGIALGSPAAWLMSLYGGAVPAGSIFALLQSVGAAGLGGAAAAAAAGVGGVVGGAAGHALPILVQVNDAEALRRELRQFRFD